MKSAQDYLIETASGENRGGFNSRLQGDSRLETLRGYHSGPRWAQRAAGWDLANGMINGGEIFSKTEIDGKKIEFKCMKDGNAWCCVGPDFDNLQESDCYAFGDTRDEAIKAFSQL